MRPYNSETDYPILFEAVRRVGKAGGFLTEAMRALAAAGIAWPNLQGNSPEATAIDRDCGRALGIVCEAHGKPIDPESHTGTHRPGYCSICNTGHKTLPAL
jgi:hypothetical protein